MIIEEIKGIKSGKKELRQFGLTIGIVLGLIGAWMLYRGKPHHLYFLSFAALFIGLGLLVPSALKPIQKAWMTLAVLMGWVMTRVILIALFYLIATPLGLIGRLVGKEFLDMKFAKDSAESYWVKRATRITRKDCERQF